MKYKLVIDLATNRIIWFTPDLDAKLQTDDRSAIAYYEGELPTEMEISNSWNYVLRDKKVSYAGKAVETTLSLLDQNKDSVKNFVIRTIDAHRHQKYPRTVYDFFVDKYTDREITGFKEYLLATEALKKNTLRFLVRAETSEEIFKIKDNFLSELEKIC